MTDPGDPLGGVPRHWNTFLDMPPGQVRPADARVVILPVPYDSTTSYRTGARDGPAAIINASRQLEDYDIELDRDLSPVGIYTAPELEPDVSGPEAMVRRVEQAVSAAAANSALVGVLGGDHSVTIGAVRAQRALHPSLSVLYLDAHADLRDEYMGTPWGHASVARRLLEICPVAEIGVRSLSTPERAFIRETKLPVVFWPSGMTADELASWAMANLTQEVYVSVDLDVFDPSLMAAVGTPEPGGMGWAEVTSLLRAVATQRRVVGFDVTELSPDEGPEACAFTAAKLTYKLIGYATATSYPPRTNCQS